MAFHQCSASAGADSGGGASGAGRPAARLAAALALGTSGGSGVSGVSPDVQVLSRDVSHARGAVLVSAPQAGASGGDRSGSASLRARPALPIFAGVAFDKAPLLAPCPVKPVFAPQGAGAPNYQNGLFGQLGHWYYLADYGKSFQPIISDAQYTLYETKRQRGLRRFDADSRAQLGERLRSMYRSLGMTRAQCAKFLHVSERTLHNWESGKHDIPYAAYRLLRIHCGYVLPGSAWHDWQFVGDALITPEGHALKPKDAAWWSLLALRADLGQKALARLARYESGQRATAAATDSDSRAAAALAGVEAGAQLPGAAGEAAAHAVAGLVPSKTSLTDSHEK